VKKKVFIGTAFFVLFLVCLQSIWGGSFSSAMKGASGYYAKEYCSCIFIEKQGNAFCKEQIKEFISASDIQTRGNKVIAKILWFSASAVFRDQRVGCVLE
jgi:hypothetical protein